MRSPKRSLPNVHPVDYRRDQLFPGVEDCDMHGADAPFELQGLSKSCRSRKLNPYLLIERICIKFPVPREDCWETVSQIINDYLQAMEAGLNSARLIGVLNQYPSIQRFWHSDKKIANLVLGTRKNALTQGFLTKKSIVELAAFFDMYEGELIWKKDRANYLINRAGWAIRNAFLRRLATGEVRRSMRNDQNGPERLVDMRFELTRIAETAPEMSAFIPDRAFIDFAASRLKDEGILCNRGAKLILVDLSPEQIQDRSVIHAEILLAGLRRTVCWLNTQPECKKREFLETWEGRVNTAVQHVGEGRASARSIRAINEWMVRPHVATQIESTLTLDNECFLRWRSFLKVVNGCPVGTTTEPYKEEMGAFNKRVIEKHVELLTELKNQPKGVPRQHVCRRILGEITELTAWLAKDTLRLAHEVARKTKDRETYGW